MIARRQVPATLAAPSSAAQSVPDTTRGLGVL